MDGESTLTVQQSDTLQQLQQVNGQQPLPQGTVTAKEPMQPAPVIEPDTVEEPEVEQVAPEGSFEYDGQLFASEKEAFEYMKGKIGQLETERLLDEARLEGQTEALRYLPQVGQPQLAPPEPEDDIDMDKFYENPKGFLKEYGAKIFEQVTAQVTAQAQARNNEEALWNQFTNKYPELADSRDIVDLVATQHAETVKALATRNQAKAMEFVANKVRERFQRYVEAQKPTRVLSNAKQGASVGSNTPVTSTTKQANVDKPLDFAQQLRQHRRR